MKHFALLGQHLTHSYSKIYFENKFKELDCNATYELCELPVIDDFINLLKSKSWNGFNVTIPYKEAIIPFLDDLDETARQIGAVNTIRVNGKQLIGYNTDTIGFQTTIEPLIRSRHSKALILGTGGASKAIQAAFQRMHIDYQLVSRNNKNCLHYSDLNSDIINQHHIIINTTPLGMWPHTDSLPQIPYEALSPQHLCYDLIYNPETTLFLSKAAAQGAHIQNGLPMLYAQAEAAYSIWSK